MLYIIRHGITDWNIEHRLQGQTDIPLNEQGKEMARTAHDEYENVHFDVCYCSPLKRAKETAALLLEGRNIPVIYDDRLREMGFGEYEGMLNPISANDCNVRVLFKNPENYKADRNAESLDSLFKRTGEFMEEIVYPLLADNKDVLIVGHGAMNSSIVCRIRELPYENFWDESIENCKLKKLI